MLFWNAVSLFMHVFPVRLCWFLQYLTHAGLVSSQCNVPTARFCSTRPVWSWVRVTPTATPTFRCARGWSTWRRATTSHCTLNSSRRRKSLISWRSLMVGLNYSSYPGNICATAALNIAHIILRPCRNSDTSSGKLEITFRASGIRLSRFFLDPWPLWEKCFPI